MEKIEIGRIVSAIGIKGEVKFYSFSDNPMRLADLEYIYIGKDEIKRACLQNWMMENTISRI